MGSGILTGTASEGPGVIEDHASFFQATGAGDLVLKIDPFEQFLSRLLHEGRVIFHEPPLPLSVTGISTGARGVLGEAFEATRLDVAGPEIAFDPSAAIEAAEVIRQACWALVCRTERVEDLGCRLVMRTPSKKATPSTHLSIDLLFRFLPQVLRRARGIDPGDSLVTMIAELLRAWPLSGVLAGLDDPPIDPKSLGFHGHAGLMLLYAERFVAHGRPSWQPAAGPALEYVELVSPGRVLAQHASVGRSEDRDDD